MRFGCGVRHCQLVSAARYSLQESEAPCLDKVPWLVTIESAGSRASVVGCESPGIGSRCRSHRSIARWGRGRVHPTRGSAPCGPAPHRPTVRFELRRRRRGRSGDLACRGPGSLGVPGTFIHQNLDSSDSDQPRQDPRTTGEPDRAVRGRQCGDRRSLVLSRPRRETRAGGWRGLPVARPGPFARGGGSGPGSPRPPSCRDRCSPGDTANGDHDAGSRGLFERGSV